MAKCAQLLVAISLLANATAFVSPLRPHGALISRRRSWVSSPLASDSSGVTEGAPSEEDEDGGTLSLDDSRLYQVELPAATGIQWGSDLQLRWVRVLGFEDASAAPSRGVSPGDQLVSVGGESVVDESLSDAMMRFGAARKEVGSGGDLSLVLFRGSAEELQDMITAAAAKAGKDIGPMRQTTSTGSKSITVTVTDESKGGKVTKLTCEPGTNLRDLLLANAINPYRNIARFSNCSGKQLCGTCIVDVTKGLVECTSVKGLDEASTLRSNPDTYRLSCVTDVYGDVDVTVGCKVGAEQWTR